MICYFPKFMYHEHVHYQAWTRILLREVDNDETAVMVFLLFDKNTTDYIFCLSRMMSIDRRDEVFSKYFDMDGIYQVYSILIWQYKRSQKPSGLCARNEDGCIKLGSKIFLQTFIRQGLQHELGITASSHLPPYTAATVTCFCWLSK